MTSKISCQIPSLCRSGGRSVGALDDGVHVVEGGTDAGLDEVELAEILADSVDQHVV